MATAREERWLPNFRRAAGCLRPHRRPLVIGLLAALGVSIFYTFSVSSIVPVLKIIFAEHESLVDWLYRGETERRLGVLLPADVPDDPRGLLIAAVRDTSPAAKVLHAGDRIVSIGGNPGSAYELAERIASQPGPELADVRVLAADGTVRTESLQLHRHRGWWDLAQGAALRLPAGRTPEDRFRMLLVVMAAVVVISLLGGVCRFINEGLVAAAVQRTMHDLRTALAEHSLRLPLEWHSVQAAGDTLSRFATDISKVETGLSTLFGKAAREPLKAIGVLALTILIDWRMLVIAIVCLPIGAIAIRTFGRLVKRAQRRASESWGRLLDHLGERLGGIRIVKAYNMEHAEGRRFAIEDRELTRAQTHIEYVDAASNPVLEMLASLAISAFILYGGSRVFHEELEPHMLFGAVVCLGGIFDPLRKLSNVNNRLQAAEASARRLFEVLDISREEPPAPPDHLIELLPFREAIEFRDIAFAYPSNPERLVLDGVSLRVGKGQVVALVGANGSGKTTLISLLLRFFAPTRGQIVIDGQDIAGVTLRSLRDQIGLVTQEAVVFSDTVRANIVYGANGVADEAVYRAARLAHVDDFIRTLRVEQNGSVTCGYDARISARTLSGGQRQRIVLARAILRDPPILILDEATSQVDSESEQRIQEALEDVTRDRTTFIIAHRFSTIARADLIVVLDAGRIIGLGRHEDLLNTCAFYGTLVKTQFAHAG
jgi:subfamily B ATP-binding cassette protein MsbA